MILIRPYDQDPILTDYLIAAAFVLSPISSPSQKPDNKKERKKILKYLFVAVLKLTDEIRKKTESGAGSESASVSSWYGSTDPEHWLGGC
jgi:hypothetical protein